MNNIKIVYATKTKHSKKIAEAIGESFDIQASNILDNSTLGEVDLLFIVGGIYGGQSLPELIEFVKSLDGEKIKNVALITSSASKKQGQAAIRSILEEKNINVLDELICQGSFLIMKFGHPNKDDIQEAVNFAKQILEKI